MKLLCTNVITNTGEPYTSKMFISGSSYEAREVTGGYMVIDDIGFERYIAKNLMSFLVMNKTSIRDMVNDNAKAYFQLRRNNYE